jgi:HSP20 family protein
LDLREEIDHLFDRAFHGWPRFGGLLSEWEPFREMESVFGRVPSRRFPHADIKERDKDYKVSIELPGVSSEDFDLTITDDTLTVKGEKKSEQEKEEKGYHVTERSYGRFERSFRLPEEVNTDKVDASFDKGVLQITLPKRPEAQRKTRKISVKANK